MTESLMQTDNPCIRCGAPVEPIMVRPLRDALEYQCTECGFREVRGLPMFREDSSLQKKELSHEEET